MKLIGRESEPPARPAFLCTRETLAATFTTMNLIIAKEIRVGNYLFRMPSEADKLRGLFDPIVEEVEEVEWMGNYFRINYLSQDDYEPIPLTLEWLSKFGFFQKKNIKTEFSFKVGDIVLIEVNEIPHSVYTDKKSTLWQIANPVHLKQRIKYVHQLQNTLQLVTSGQLE